MTTTLTHRPPDRHQADGRRETQNPTATPSPGAVEPPPPRIDDGAISDARHHARRRRFRTGIAAIATAGLLGTGLLMAFAGNGGPSKDTQGAADASRPGIAAIGDADGVVASWARLHVGWIFVYGDGRLLTHPDGADSIRETHLSTRDLERIATAEPSVDAFPRPWALPEGAWSRTETGKYEAELYAICPSPGMIGTPGESLGSVSAIADRLPADARAAVLGTVRAFTGDDPRMVGYQPARGGTTKCWVVTPDQAEVVWRHTDTREDGTTPDGVFAPHPSQYTAWSELVIADGTTVELVAVPLLPHGGFVIWGG